MFPIDTCNIDKVYRLAAGSYKEWCKHHLTHESSLQSLPLPPPLSPNQTHDQLFTAELLSWALILGKGKY
jgi:hypothetical protein